MPKAAPIEAIIGVTIEHHEGPVIADPDHVRRWLVADDALKQGLLNGFTFDVCPRHPDWEACECFDEEFATYHALIVTAKW